MKPSLTDILPLLNANCGDVLKATLLHEFFPTLPKINPIWLKAPTGEVEAAFATLKAAKPVEIKSDKILADVLADHAKIEDTRIQRKTDPQVATLIREHSTAKPIGDMPDFVRFEDIQPRDLAPVTTNILTDEKTITAEEAAKRFGYSYVGLLKRLKMAGIDGARLPGHGRTKYYSLEKVEIICGAKGKHVR